ncbi:hypothetical protein Tco_0792233 [Tanacetum coccineum]
MCPARTHARLSELVKLRRASAEDIRTSRGALERDAYFGTRWVSDSGGCIVVGVSEAERPLVLLRVDISSVNWRDGYHSKRRSLCILPPHWVVWGVWGCRGTFLGVKSSAGADAKSVVTLNLMQHPILFAACYISHSDENHLRTTAQDGGSSRHRFVGPKEEPPRGAHGRTIIQTRQLTLGPVAIDRWWTVSINAWVKRLLIEAKHHTVKDIRLAIFFMLVTYQYSNSMRAYLEQGGTLTVWKSILRIVIRLPSSAHRTNPMRTADRGTQGEKVGYDMKLDVEGVARLEEGVARSFYNLMELVLSDDVESVDTLSGSARVDTKLPAQNRRKGKTPTISYNVRILFVLVLIKIEVNMKLEKG